MGVKRLQRSGKECVSFRMSRPCSEGVLECDFISRKGIANALID